MQMEVKGSVVAKSRTLLTKSQVIPSLQGLTVSSLQRISKHKLGRLELPHFTDKVPATAPIAQLVEQLTLNQ